MLDSKFTIFAITVIGDTYKQLKSVLCGSFALVTIRIYVYVAANRKSHSYMVTF